MSLSEKKNNKSAFKTIKAQKKSHSSLKNAFLERPLPESEEVSRFEDLIKKEVLSEEAEQDLSAIYSDNKGEPVDVSRVKKKKRLALIVFFKQIFVLTIIACALYGAYYFYFQRPAGSDALVFRIEAPEKISAGENFSYYIIYENKSGLTLNQSEVELILPNNFVITETNPVSEGSKNWSLGTIYPEEIGRIEIKGHLLAPVDAANVITARLNYIPSNFSSEFKKEATANTLVSGVGFLLNLDYVNTALVANNNEINLNLTGFNNNYIDNFILEIKGSDNLQLKNQLEIKSSTEESGLIVENIGDGRWLISALPNVSNDRFIASINFTFKDKVAETEEIYLRLFKKEADAKELTLWEKNLALEVVKSDFNLELFLNNEKTDQAVNFGSNLNYRLLYTNNGEAILYDVVLMAVVKGAVDWNTLAESLNATAAGNSIVWSKEQVPALAELAPGESGEITFTLKVKDFSVANIGSDNEIIAYSQYNLAADSEQAEEINEDRKSNTIRSLINSDLSLTEKILYFNEDNIPVGSGPLPPQVGETTSVRVFWTIKNNLHDLEDLEVNMILPAGINWSGEVNTNVGRISYDDASRLVTWRLGYLPLSVYRADAEFSLNLRPNESDRDKILVISAGSTVKAIDAVTRAEISHKTSAKTTKLEDDEIAGLSNNGRVE